MFEEIGSFGGIDSPLLRTWPAEDLYWLDHLFHLQPLNIVLNAWCFNGIPEREADRMMRAVQFVLQYGNPAVVAGRQLHSCGEALQKYIAKSPFEIGDEPLGHSAGSLLAGLLLCSDCSDGVNRSACCAAVNRTLERSDEVGIFSMSWFIFCLRAVERAGSEVSIEDLGKTLKCAKENISDWPDVVLMDPKIRSALLEAEVRTSIAMIGSDL